MLLPFTHCHPPGSINALAYAVLPDPFPEGDGPRDVGHVPARLAEVEAGRQAVARRRLKFLVREMLALGPEDDLTVSEIACRDPGCSDRETVILIMRAGQRTQAYKVADAIELVGADELRAVLTGS